MRVQSLSLRDVNRQFICEAGAIVMNEEKKKKDDNYLFLFSDLLVLSKPQPKGVYKFKAAINLQYASISPISDGGTTPPIERLGLVLCTYWRRLRRSQERLPLELHCRQGRQEVDSDRGPYTSRARFAPEARSSCVKQSRAVSRCVAAVPESSVAQISLGNPGTRQYSPCHSRSSWMPTIQYRYSSRRC